MKRIRTWQRSLLDSFSARKTDVLLQEFATNHTWQVPTFPVLVHMGFMTPQTDLRDDIRSKFLSSQLRLIWVHGRKEILVHRGTEDFALRRDII